MNGISSLECAQSAERVAAYRGGALISPIQLSTTFYQGQAGYLEDGSPLLYRRQANPAHFEIESRFASLEGAAASLLFSSGMAAITTVLRTLERGDEVIVPRSVYWTLRVWLEDFADSHAFTVRWVDHATPEAVRAQLSPATRLIWAEVPANPSLRVIDIAALVAVRPPQARLVVDATCASPALLQPLRLGADLVLHSLSKCVGGHNDLLGGVVSTVRQDTLWERVRTLRWVVGNALSPFDSHLLSRSLETLSLRMRSASASALTLARHLATHPAVREVVYPGLSAHPDHAVARAQMPHGQGCLIGVSLHGGAVACATLCSSTRLWRNATSFGGTTSLLEHRFAAEYRVRQSGPDYVRLSVGLEDVALLQQDLFQALDMATEAAGTSYAPVNRSLDATLGVSARDAVPA